MHSHDDRLIKKCPVCQQAIRDIIESGKELDRLGTWDIPELKKMEDGVEYTIWKRNETTES